ncbi:hypothetical protein N7492_005840 [Penicillium capsulatum]|uniref:CHY-type domain-containing protein n=1 Tax=Penicillium capsulatum TaxID=69766 RepID=A0A9W9LRI7_9EURO|nr:hypothetical protein N7492_005840 [Penicillium capsulatum]KAJ6135060.1 hypothetical protein N7512_000220 [Penicillium capsulatum]
MSLFCDEESIAVSGDTGAACCRAGAECPFAHDSPATDQSQSQLAGPQPSGPDAQNPIHGVATAVQNLNISGNESKPKSTAPHAQSQRPVSKAEHNDPREFQINQLRRRYRPTETPEDDGSSLSFGVTPSDPDFPFELDSLQCVLHVPSAYPGSARPTLRVTNPEMDLSFRDNVARGFDDIVDFTLRMNGRGNLLNWMNSLDKQLERLLTTLERGPRLTFVANTRNSTVKEPGLNAPNPHIRVPQTEPTVRAPVVTGKSPSPTTKAPAFTAEQKADAEKRRSTETKQLEARLGRLPLFQKRTDTSFTVPIQPNKPERLPGPLQTIKTVKLLVPLLYPLEHISIELQGNNSPEARSVEIGFMQWVQGTSQLNLVSQINYLASNIHNFAKTPLAEVAKQSQPENLPTQVDTHAQEQAGADIDHVENEDKPHLHVIPRPPEWSVPGPGSGSDVTDDSSFDETSGEEEEDEDGGAPVPAVTDAQPGRGVALSLPFLELYGIELLELMDLAITIKCERCKESMDIKNVPHLKEAKDMPRSESCKKCANSMSIGFRRQLMHSHANRAGYLDLDGCTIVDLLPSNFIPTCAECSTTHPAPGVSAVRGESAMAICRHCHRKMVFKMPEVKFLVVGTAAVSSRAGLPLKKKPKEVLGIVAGQELPRRGRCQHYGKSYRWFRFGCCAKVFPCDKCHDTEADHPNEHANRMICGFCSREQIYRPENCGICKAVLVGKAGSGFWEGGKGTRNRALMSRKDPRKFRRRGGNVPSGSSSSKRK